MPLSLSFTGSSGDPLQLESLPHLARLRSLPTYSLQRASSSALNDCDQDSALDETGRCWCPHPAKTSISINSGNPLVVLMCPNEN